MRRSYAPAFLHAMFFLALLAAIALPGVAQNQGESAAAQPATRAYDATKEVVLHGTISQVVQRPAAGLPLGLHLLVSTARGAVDAPPAPSSPRLAAEKGLVAGATIQITGVTSHFEP